MVVIFGRLRRILKFLRSKLIGATELLHVMTYLTYNWHRLWCIRPPTSTKYRQPLSSNFNTCTEQRSSSL